MVFAKGGYNHSHGSVPKFKKAVLADPTILQPFRAARKKLISLKLDDPQMHLSKFVEALAPSRKVVAENEEEDEVCAPEEEFYELWKYVLAFGQPAKEQVVEETFRKKTMLGVWVIPEDNQGKYTRRKSAKRRIKDTTSLCDTELSENQADTTYQAGVLQLLAQMDTDRDPVVVCRLGDSSGKLAIQSSKRLGVKLV